MLYQPKADGLTQFNPSSVNETVRIGQEAMARKRRGWADWLAIAMGEWLVANGFKEIDKGVRSRLLECLQHRTEIDQWLSRLTDSERFRFNHPNTVLKRWKGSTVVPDPNATPKPSPFAKLKDAHAELIEHCHRLQRKIETADEGDLWKPTDTAADIANVMIAALSPAKAERTAKEILRRLKERKAGT